MDSVRINTIARRSHSILMWRIYDKAHMVTAWLSDLREDADLALELLGDGNKLLDEIIQQWVYFAPTQPADEIWYREGQWCGLSCLLRRPWFTRCWVIQEIAVAR